MAHKEIIQAQECTTYLFYCDDTIQSQNTIFWIKNAGEGSEVLSQVLSLFPF
jgi:hypothetical protein